MVAATSSQQDTRLLSLVEKLVDLAEKLEKGSRETCRGDRQEQKQTIKEWEFNTPTVVLAIIVGGLGIWQRTVSRDPVQE